MGWEILLPIVAREGLTIGYELWKLQQAKQLPTQEDWDKLLVLRKAEDFRREAFARAGLPVPPAS